MKEVNKTGHNKITAKWAQTLRMTKLQKIIFLSSSCSHIQSKEWSVTFFHMKRAFPFKIWRRKVHEHLLSKFLPLKLVCFKLLGCSSFYRQIVVLIFVYHLKKNTTSSSITTKTRTFIPSRQNINNTIIFFKSNISFQHVIHNSKIHVYEEMNSLSQGKT